MMRLRAAARAVAALHSSATAASSSTSSSLWTAVREPLAARLSSLAVAQHQHQNQHRAAYIASHPWLAASGSATAAPAPSVALNRSHAWHYNGSAWLATAAAIAGAAAAAAAGGAVTASTDGSSSAAVACDSAGDDMSNSEFRHDLALEVVAAASPFDAAGAWTGNRAAVADAVVQHKAPGRAGPPQVTADMVEQSMPAVVRLRPTQDAVMKRQALQSTGSGFIISGHGLIVTNAHVARSCAGHDGNGIIRVSLYDGQTVEARVLGMDPYSDVAVLQAVSDRTDFPHVPIGYSSDIRVGDPVVALGYPLGLKLAATSGILSSHCRMPGDDVDTPQRPAMFGRWAPQNDHEAAARDIYERSINASGMLQTDARLSPGNSGGPILNADGQVIGMATLVLAASGIFAVNLALPMDSAVPIIKQIVRQGGVSRNYLGLSVVPLTPAVVRREVSVNSGFPGQPGHGLLISTVEADSPAAVAGLRSGDVVTHLDKTPVTSVGQFLSHISVFEADRVLQLTVLHADGTSNVVGVKPRELPPQ